MGRKSAFLCIEFIYSEKATKFCEISTVDLTVTKAELLQEGIIFLVHLFARAILFTPSPRVTRILVPEKHRAMRKPC